MKYVSPKRFASISKGKEVKNFPNPAVKEIDGIRYEIVDNPTCIIKKLEEKDYPWYLGLSKDVLCKKYTCEDVYILTVSTGFFPKDLVVGVKRGMYREDTELSKKTGWLNSSCLGSASEAFTSLNVNEAIKILRKNGFMFNFINQ